jgi:hypothetical protein
MTIVREEENGDNGHHAGGAWRGGRCPLSRDTRAGALARFGLIDRRVQDGCSMLRCVGPTRARGKKGDSLGRTTLGSRRLTTA